MLMALPMSPPWMRSTSSALPGARRTCTPDGPSHRTSASDVRIAPAVGRSTNERVDGRLGLGIEPLLRDRDHDDPRAGRRRTDALGDVQRDREVLLAAEESVEHHDVRLLGRDLSDRGRRVALNAGDLDLLLARQHRLKVLRDLRKVFDEKNALHAEASLVERARRSPMEAASAAAAATARNDRPIRNVMPCQYQSGYSRTRLLVAGSNKKFPCGKKTW